MVEQAGLGGPLTYRHGSSFEMAGIGDNRTLVVALGKRKALS